ncbi:MAG: hypothetical protein Q7J86_13000 [Bacteroidota bacterium]|nr:hypothetical protein [Bacteroidota bacterium]MDO9615428.1 hypothetical protein [Bacteroidota bacterium]
MKTVIQIVLVAVAIILAYLLYTSVERPLDFEKAKKERYNATIERLKDIRKAEIAYKDIHGKFTGSWDTLINFVKTGELPLVRKIGMLTDSMIEAGWTEKRALKEGKIIRDTIYVNVLDTIFGKGYKIDDIKFIPVKDTVAMFQLGAGIITTGSGIKVPVFEAKAHNNTILYKLDRQLVINLNESRRTNDKYPGLKVGSLEETINNAGNWE